MADVQGKVQLRKHFHCLNFIMVVEGFFSFLFSFSLFAVVTRENLIHRWVAHFCPLLWKGRRELENQGKDHYDGENKGKLSSHRAACGPA